MLRTKVSSLLRYTYNIGKYSRGKISLLSKVVRYDASIIRTIISNNLCNY